jgi:Putative beta-barrel porin-2, OmpL-like. bbp2
MQILWRPTPWLSVVGNEYALGEDALNTPGRVRYHSDDSVEVKYYDKPYNGISKMAFSLTGDIGCEHGGGVAVTQIRQKDRSRTFSDSCFTTGCGSTDNPGRYLALSPPINGATASSGTPFFTGNPGDPFKAWDASSTFDYMPKQYITFRWEFDHRAANVAYFSGAGGTTPTSCPTAVLVETSANRRDRLCQDSLRI